MPMLNKDVSTGGVMNIKLGQVMSSSRLISFVAFLAATFAWVLNMPALFFVSASFLIISAIVYFIDVWKNSTKPGDAET